LADLALAAASLLNLPVSALVVSLFGPTPEIVASFTFAFEARSSGMELSTLSDDAEEGRGRSLGHLRRYSAR
jgi:hypothetical protein